MNNSVKLSSSIYFKYKKNSGTVVILSQINNTFYLKKNGVLYIGSTFNSSDNALNCEKILLMSDITINGTGLIFDSDGDCTLSLYGPILFNGNNKKLILNNCTDWIGFIQSDSLTSKNSPTIMNLNLEGSSTTLGLVSSQYSTSFLIKYNSLFFNLYKCVNNLDINNTGCGGLSPSFLNTSGSYYLIYNCTNNGEITSEKAGGICAQYNCYSDDNISFCRIQNCNNTSTIANNSGGICGNNNSNSINNGNVYCIISNCSNTGSINGNNGGGITGVNTCNTNNGKVKLDIINCNNSGPVGNNSGGIFGSNSIDISQNGNIDVNITNCNNTGNLNGNLTGGICGYKNSYISNEGTINIQINNCNNSGKVVNEGGGICGKNNFIVAGNGTINIDINKCSNTGILNGNDAGGICGSNNFNISGSGTINLNINECYNIGKVVNEGGGICGSYNANISGSGTINSNITFCYNKGMLNGNDGGGICGSYFAKINGNGSIKSFISNCYNTGQIVNEGGGICGSYNADISGSGSIISIFNNCYNTGDMTGNGSGGICGGNGINANNTSNVLCIISNCYNIGDIHASAGGICGNNSVYATNNSICLCILINCFVYNSYFVQSSKNGAFLGENNLYSDGTSTSNILLDNVISNIDKYYFDASGSVYYSGSTILSQDLSGNGIGTNNITINEINNLFKNKANIADWIFNPGENQKFMNQERTEVIHNDEIYFPLLNSNNLAVRDRKKIRIYTDNQLNINQKQLGISTNNTSNTYNFSDIINYKVAEYLYFIFIRSLKKNYKNIILFENSVKCKKYQKCINKLINGQFQVNYDIGEIVHATNAVDQTTKTFDFTNNNVFKKFNIN